MNYFPIFLRLENQPVLVVGGGAIALRKIELLRKAKASVTVVAPQLETEVAKLAAQGAIQHIDSEFLPEHLDGKRLAIAATDRRSINAWVAHQAEARGIAVNVVDDRELSRFIMPAIIDRSPVIVAVSSGGDAPVLTRRLREKLEAFLPMRLGLLANWAGTLRNKIKQRVLNAGQRRQFWESFFDGPIAADMLAGREQQADAAVKHFLSDATRALEPQGEVALVGAGPGDAGLLTLRALRLLQNADVVLHDRLVSAEVLQLVRRDAQLIGVGKAADCPSVSQATINALLIEHAKSGKRVVRLKGGDPFIFGRGGEELAALAQQGIRFEVVPGVTAAAGCAAYAGIPLTHRDYAQSLTFVTGHLKDDRADANTIDWAALAKPAQTIVFYMSLNRLAEILTRLSEHGAPPDRAAAIIEQGTHPSQRVVIGNISTLVARAQTEQVKSPALLIVGEVTRLHETLSWFNRAAPSASLADGMLSA